MDKKTIIIIGGGAAGFFCAANLDETLYQIIILEQNKDVLQKVKVSGGGRCNVTHACFDPRELVHFYPRGNKELLSVFSKFQPGDTMAWFEDRNVSLKIEGDNRVFPVSNSSQTIIDTLINEAHTKKVKVKTQQSVKAIETFNKKFKVITNKEDFLADYVVFTTGSSPKSMKLIASLGHDIVPLVPSLFTFNIKDEILQDLTGTSFPYAEIKISGTKFSQFGAVLITHWGLSGPAILKLSAYQARFLADKKYKFDIEINFVSETQEDLIEKLNALKLSHPKKSIGQSKIAEVTNRFWQRLLIVSNIDPEKQNSQLSKNDIKNLCVNLCKRKLSVNGKSTFKEEFVTAGGVNLKQINFKTMVSKIIPNLYIAGEVLDIDAVTGGFNFQACWSEAWLIAQDLNDKNID